jgi:hypothetical protein
VRKEEDGAGCGVVGRLLVWGGDRRVSEEVRNETTPG